MKQVKSQKRYLFFVAGGTGGHLYPALALANTCKNMMSDLHIIFIGHRKHLECRVVPKYGYDILFISVQGFVRRSLLGNVMFTPRLVWSIVQSLWYIIMYKPCGIIGFGGYLSVPVVWVGSIMGIRTFIHEQNVFPGIANRFLSRVVRAIYTNFSESHRYFRNQNIYNYGLPVRAELSNANRNEAASFFGFNVNDPVLLIVGGSGGASFLNAVAKRYLHRWHTIKKWQIIWQCGAKDIDNCKAFISKSSYSNLHLTPFIDKMEYAYALATVVLCRAGASTCVELSMLSKCAVLIPYPTSSGDHQRKNAEFIKKIGGCMMFLEGSTDEGLADTLDDLMKDSKKRHAMEKNIHTLYKSNASKRMAYHILEQLNIKKDKS